MYLTDMKIQLPGEKFSKLSQIYPKWVKYDPLSKRHFVDSDGKAYKRTSVPGNHERLQVTVCILPKLNNIKLDLTR